MSEEQFSEVQSKIDEVFNLMNEIQDKLIDIQENSEGGDKISTLNEIIKQAEDSDYGIKRWRTLETKQDVINAIKKEVLDVV